MVTGIGVDIIQVARFNAWVEHGASKKQALLSSNELEDCFSCKNNAVIAQRLAVRFAAKEAFYKALSASFLVLSIDVHVSMSLRFVAQHCYIAHSSLGNPVLHVDWVAIQKKIGTTIPSMRTHLSLSHEKQYAVAFVTLSLL